MRKAIAAAILLAGAGCGSPANPETTSTAASRPNVILITVDTLRADRLSSYGYGRAETPAIDSLARDGVLFEQAIAPAPLTLPSHCSLMTGTLPPSHGVRDNSGFVLPDEAETLAESLSAAEYATGAFVGAYVLDSRFGLSQGFGHYYDDFDSEAIGGPTMQILERPAEDVLIAARDWILSLQGKRFFSWIHLFDPHAPYAPPSPGDRSYDGEVAYVDASLGAFWDFLRKSDLYDSTLIVLTSDHGEGLGEHGEATHGMFLYDSTLRVPLIVKAPGLKRASRVLAPVRLIDVMPTVLEAVGSPLPRSTEGVSLLPALKGGSLAELPAYGETLLPLLNYGWSDIYSYRTARHKYIQSPTPELYDLGSDPGETSNLLPGNQAVANALKAEKDRLVARLGGNEAGKAWRTPDAETTERLRSLGYASLSIPSGTPEKDPIEALRRSLGGGLADPKAKIEIFNLIWEAQAASAQGSHAESNRILDNLLSKDSGIFMAHSIRALNLLQLRQPAEASRSLRQAVKLRPEDPGARLYLALAELELGNLDSAASSFERALELDPLSEAARNNLATVYARQKKYAKAAAILEEMARRRPDDAAASLNLGVVHMLQSKREAAFKAFREALRRQPNIPEAHNNLGLLHLEEKNAEAAVTELQRAIQLRPDYANARINLAKAYRLLGRDREADEQMKLARSGRPPQ